MGRVWAGVDIGKEHHHCVAIGDHGDRLLSSRVANDEAELTELIAEVVELGEETVWAIDLIDGPASLFCAVLRDHGNGFLFVPGRSLQRIAAVYPGAGKTDARDAAILAQEARVRHGLRPRPPLDPIAVDLQLLTARRTDLVCDRTRTFNRLRGHLTTITPALERALDVRRRGVLTLLTGYQTPTALRRIGPARLTTWLHRRGVQSPRALAERATAAARLQSVRVTGETLAAACVAEPAAEALVLHRRVDDVDHRMKVLFHDHHDAALITSMPGIGDILGAEFIAATGGDMARFPTANHLASYAGLAPVPHDSGKYHGIRHRPRNYHRGLQRVFYQSARISVRCCAASQTYYDRKRGEGKSHTQAVIALARRRVNVLWAILRDRQPYQGR
ncbi:IS110 family transposase [Streptomyces sp. SID3343]|uniref:IS110 family transposase n=1 Tax=Streptomyces sp. SID3343 TaxID=2690260 RepID=UPI00136DEBDF|nr:IS110 family transposase [Streptomyces sp. SID3343]